MPTFSSSQPVSVTVRLVSGSVRLTAEPRDTVEVTVQPADPTLEPDHQAADQTRVDLATDRLVVAVPQPKRRFSWFTKAAAVDVTVAVPSGSSVHCDAGTADIRLQGRFADCRITTGTGNIWVDAAESLVVKTGRGDVTVSSASAGAEITGTGRIDLDSVDGSAVVQNLNGRTAIGRVRGPLRCSSANGSISIEQPLSGVVAKTANGSIRVGQIVADRVVLSTAHGNIDVGVSAGTAALLDVRSEYGRVRTELATSDGPQPHDTTAEVRATTGYGDISIRRA